MITKSRLTYYASLTRKRGRDAERKFIVEGWRAVEEAYTAGEAIETLFVSPAALAAHRHAVLLKKMRRSARETFEVSEREFERLAETVHAQGIAAVVPKRANAMEAILNHVARAPLGIVVALDRVAEPGNAGAIIRACDWFGADAVILGRGCVDLHNPKTVRATVGSMFHLPVAEGVDLLQALPALAELGFAAYGAEPAGGVDVRAVMWLPKSVLVIGNEADGIAPEVSALLSEHVAIPRFGKAESLNAASAASVLLALMRLR